MTQTKVSVALPNCAQDARSENTPFAFKNRVKEFEKYLQDIIFLLEARASDTFLELLQFYERNGYKTLWFKNNDTPMSMGILLAVNTKNVQLVDSECFWHNGEKNKRFPDNAWGTIGVRATFKKFNGKVFSVIATQFPFSVDNKYLSFNACLEHIRGPTLLIGDFNTFYDNPAEEELMKKIKKIKGTHLINEGTWLGSDNDVPIPNGQVGNQLDHAIAFNGLNVIATLDKGHQLAESINNNRFSDHSAIICTISEEN